MSPPSAPVVAASPPPYGFYEYFDLAHGLQPLLLRLDMMAAAGCTYVVPYDILFGTPQEVHYYLSYAASLGMQCMLTLNGSVWYTGDSLVNAFPNFGRGIGATDNPSFVRGMINLVKDHPGFWGYYVGDEVAAAYHAQVKATADTLAELDPQHPRFFVASVNPGPTSADFQQNVTPFLDCCDIMGGDYYPFGYDDNPGVDAFGTTCRQMQALCDAAGVQSAFVLQAFAFTSYGTPTCEPWPDCGAFPTLAQMRTQRAVALANARPAVLIWYSFFDMLGSSTNPFEVIRNWANVVVAASGR